MTSFSDFDETVELVLDMLEQLDTESVELHEIEEQRDDTVQSGSETQGPSTHSERDEADAQDGESDQFEEADTSESLPEKAVHQPHQYIIRVETPVGPDYVVRAVEGEAYFDIIADYNLVWDIASFYNSDTLDTVSIDELDSDHPLFLDFPREQLVKMEEEDGSEVVDRLYKAYNALDNLDDDVKADIIYQLTEIFTTSPVKYVVESTRENGKGGTKGFQVFYRIFPYDDKFNLADLNDVVEQVRMATQRGKIFLKYSFQLDIDFGEETGGSSVQANPPQKSTKWEID